MIEKSKSVVLYHHVISINCFLCLIHPSFGNIHACLTQVLEKTSHITQYNNYFYLFLSLPVQSAKVIQIMSKKLDFRGLLKNFGVISPLDNFEQSFPRMTILISPVNFLSHSNFCARYKIFFVLRYLIRF